MMKKLLALLLVALMLTGMFAGCGSSSSESSTEEDTTTVEEATEEDEEAEEVAEAEEVEETEEVEDDSSEDATTEEEEAPADAVYGTYTMNNPDITAWPSDDGTVITAWTTMPLSTVGLESSADVLCWQMLAEITGYEFDFTDANPETAATNFTLMVAADDLTDIIYSATSYYTTGGGAAIEDGMIIDFAEYIEDYIPNLQALMDKDPSLEMDVSTDDGYIPGVFSVLTDSSFADQGYSIRMDLLEELGLEAPETYDEMYDVLTALVNAGYGGMALSSSGVHGSLISGFGVAGEYTSVAGSSYPFYVDGDTVKYGHIEEGFREYIETIAKWYSEGLIYSDFISVGSDMSTDTDLILNNQVSVFYSEAATLPTIQAEGETVIEGFEVYPIKNLRQEVGSTDYYSSYPSHTENSWSVAAKSEVIYEILELFNFMYSEEGSLICNYGEEGVSYVVNDDGSYSFTDLVLNHEMGTRMGMMCYVMMGGPYISDSMRLINAYEPLAYEASVNYWTVDATDITSMPTGVSLTSDENSEISAIMSDIMTYSSTMIAKYITGDEDVANFDEFVSTIESMGIQDAIDIYQGAYDRYLEK